MYRTRCPRTRTPAARPRYACVSPSMGRYCVYYSHNVLILPVWTCVCGCVCVAMLQLLGSGVFSYIATAPTSTCYQSVVDSSGVGSSVSCSAAGTCTVYSSVGCTGTALVSVSSSSCVQSGGTQLYYKVTPGYTPPSATTTSYTLAQYADNACTVRTVTPADRVCLCECVIV